MYIYIYMYTIIISAYMCIIYTYIYALIYNIYIHAYILFIMYLWMSILWCRPICSTRPSALPCSKARLWIWKKVFCSLSSKQQERPQHTSDADFPWTQSHDFSCVWIYERWVMGSIIIILVTDLFIKSLRVRRGRFHVQDSLAYKTVLCFCLRSPKGGIMFFMFFWIALWRNLYI